MRSLRIAHIADTHLGYRSGTLRGRSADFSNSWIHACRAIVDSKPDLIIHAGDVFDHPSPPWDAVLSCLQGFRILQEAGVPILVISGNHDTARLRSSNSVFNVLQQFSPNVHIHHEYLPRLVRFDELDLEVVLASHPALTHPNIETNVDWETLSLSGEGHTILVSHGSVGNKQEADEAGSLVIPDTLFEYPWSYVALGHLHVSQPHGKNGWYSGSTERSGWRDYPANPSWTMTTIDSEERVRHYQKPVPHVRMVQVPTIHVMALSNDEVAAEVDLSLKMMGGLDERAFARVTLESCPADRRRSTQYAVQAKIRRVYPNLSLQVVMGETKVEDDIRQTEPRAKSSSVKELFAEFIEARNFDPEFRSKFESKGITALDEAEESQALLNE